MNPIMLHLILGLVACVPDHGDITSGPKLGEKAVGFSVRAATGPKKGNTLCYRCRFGLATTTCVFARGLTSEVETLVVGLEAEVAEAPELKVLVVFLTEDNLDDSLERLVARRKLAHIQFATIKPSSVPPSYQLADEAEVTTVLWKEFVVQAVHATRHLDGRGVKQVLAEVRRSTQSRTDSP